MKLEDILSDKSICFEQKIRYVITVWLRLKQLVVNTHSRCHKLIEWIQSHTLGLILQGDWALQTTERKHDLCRAIEDFDQVVTSFENLTNRRYKKLIQVIRDPWGDKTLCKILNNPDTCTKEEELTYFSSEPGFLIAMRLKTLCDSRCEDLALRFAKTCLRCFRSPESQYFDVITTEDQKRYILDVYIALLHKFKRFRDIMIELKNLTLDEGLKLVQRFSKKRIEIAQIWKRCSRIAELTAQFFMTAAMIKPVNEIEYVLTELLNIWVSLNDKEGIDMIPTIIRRIIQTANSAAHIYICCKVLHKKFNEKIKSFIIELYIRALTTDMNEMEKQKTRLEIDKVTETSKRLSEGFLGLADLLQDHLGVSRECVLTSFSLNPTRSCLKRIQQLAIVSGKIPTDNEDTAYLSSSETSSCLSNTLPVLTIEPHLQPSNLDALILIKGEAVTGSKNYDVLSAPNQVLDTKARGLSEQICNDLAVVLSSPRYQMLSWVLDWKELKNTCDRYLSNAEMRNTVKELKYLNIDYNQFKDWPSDEERTQYGGIEKGYEPQFDDNNGIILQDPSRRKGRSKYDSHGSGIDTADSLDSDDLHVSKKSKKSSKITKRKYKKCDTLNKTDNNLATLITMPHMNPKIILKKFDLNNCTITNSPEQENNHKANKEKLESPENKSLNNNNKYDKMNMYPYVVLIRCDNKQPKV